FDFFAGTSTGCILSLLLNTPNPASATDLLDIYLGEDGQKIFKKNLLTNLNYVFKGEKYNKKGIEEVLGRRFEESCLKDSLNPVLITSYETEGRNATFFTSYDNRYKDLYMKDIARSTSAAPTYFEPYKIPCNRNFF
ncbi:MAG: patatin-like phospholipase family protein, partial [Candidatus Gastranaerophilales bacterium]|nr:patatin-like phospholipase family protein [Candidatus Gastranaerophilales bacterium]